MVSGPVHPLWRALASDEPDPDAVTPAALEQAFARDRPRVWHSLTRRSVQTNEVSRAVAWLWPAALASTAPLILCDMGCSAGLNLVADAIGLSWSQPGPRPLTLDEPRVSARFGFDRAPLDAIDDDDAAWLRACIWAGERDRLDRLERALLAFRAATVRPTIERVDARDMPARLAELGAIHDGALWLAYQTLVREYLGDDREPYLAGMRRWIRSRPGRALWIELEDPPHGATRERPAAIMAHVGRADGSVLDLVLARCQYHPTEIAPEPDAVAALQAALAPWSGSEVAS